MYDQLKASRYPICAVDYWRYAMMAYGGSGGWYMDLDTDCYRSLSNLEAIPGAKIVLGSPFNHYRYLECAIMGSVANHPFWYEVLDDIDRSLRTGRYWWISYLNSACYVLTLTGPICLGRVVAHSHYRNEIAMVARDTLYHESWFSGADDNNVAGTSSCMIASHKQHNTWIDPTSFSARFGAACRALPSVTTIGWILTEIIIGIVVIVLSIRFYRGVEADWRKANLTK